MLPKIQDDMRFGVVLEAGARDVAKASNPYELDVKVNTMAVGQAPVAEVAPPTITSRASFCC